MEFLKTSGVNVEDKILMNGFSASGKFVTRFTLMHPEMVQAVAAGGVNAILTLPLESLDGERIRYPVGVSDLANLTGKVFDFPQYARVPHFVFMGSLDINDQVQIKYAPETFDIQDIELIYNLIGEKMMPDRWMKTQIIFSQLGCNRVSFKTYEGVDHRYVSEIIDGLINFFTANTQYE